MPLEYTKHAIAAVWVLAVVVLGIATNVRSTRAWIVLAAVAIGAPLIMRLLWKSPAQTTSESIQQARR